MLDDAIQKDVARAEEEAWRRGIDGYDHAVWYKGEQVGVEKRFSDQLLLTVLKAHHPAYRDRTEVDVKANVEVNWADFVSEMRKEAESGETVDAEYEVEDDVTPEEAK